MKVPAYQPGRLGDRLRRRVYMAMLVAVLGMVSGFLIYPWIVKQRYLRQVVSDDPVLRVRGLNGLCRLARHDASLSEVVESNISDLLDRDDENIRPAVIRIASWSVLNLPSMRERLEQQLDSANDRVFFGLATALREAGIWDEQSRSQDQRCRLAVLGCVYSDAARLPEAISVLASCGPDCAPRAEMILDELLHHPAASVRVAAVEAVSICLPLQRIERLTAAIADESPAVAAEASGRLAVLRSIPSPPTAPKVDDQPLVKRLETGEYFTRLQAMDDLMRAQPGDLQDRRRLIFLLRGLVQEGLQLGNGGLAGHALIALAHLGDRPFLQVMLDVAGTQVDQPMLRYLAARAAAVLDPVSGTSALANLLSQDSDDVRDLAAFELAREDDPAVVRRLSAELFSTSPNQRGPAAWALSLKGDPHLQVHGLTLEQLMIKRTTLTTDNIHAEVDWKPRGYYLCARRLLGDDSQRDALELYLLNEHFPRLAIYTTFLHCGEATVLDVVLGSDVAAAPAVVELIRDRGFGRILSQYIPQAPTVPFGSPPEERSEAARQLIRFWSIFRWQLEFDQSAHVYRISEPVSSRQ